MADAVLATSPPSSRLKLLKSMVVAGATTATWADAGPSTSESTPASRTTWSNPSSASDASTAGSNASVSSAGDASGFSSLAAANSDRKASSKPAASSAPMLSASTGSNGLASPAIGANDTSIVVVGASSGAGNGSCSTPTPDGTSTLISSASATDALGGSEKATASTTTDSPGIAAAGWSSGSRPGGRTSPWRCSLATRWRCQRAMSQPSRAAARSASS